MFERVCNWSRGIDSICKQYPAQGYPKINMAYMRGMQKQYQPTFQSTQPLQLPRNLHFLLQFPTSLLLLHTVAKDMIAMLMVQSTSVVVIPPRRSSLSIDIHALYPADKESKESLVPNTKVSVSPVFLSHEILSVMSQHFEAKIL